MSDQNAIYIASISGGKCIENTQKDKGECRLRKWNKSPSQQWLVEPSSEDPNIIAFKSVADEQYLAALQPDKMYGGKIGVQQEKQWFTLEPGRGPEWFHVKCNSSFGSGKPGYLNDEWGRLNDDNKIQTYQYEKNNPGFNTFYFPHAQVADGESFQPPSAAADGEDGKKEELDAREKELQEREDALNEKEESQTEKDNALEEKEQDQTKQAKALEKREAAVAQKEKELAGKKPESKAPDAPKQDGDPDRAKALEEKEAALSKKEADLQRREKELASKPASAPQANGVSSPATEQTSGSNAQDGGSRDDGKSSDQDVHEICRLYRENDNLKAKVKIGELEARLRELEAKLREGSCQHKVKQPPRKIDHRVVGSQQVKLVEFKESTNNTVDIDEFDAKMSGGWNTIESDAGVFTFLIESLGVKNVQFEELIDLSSESLQQLSPVGVIFLFRYQSSGPQPSKDKPLDGEFDYAALDSQGSGEEGDKPVWFAAQTIQNACGTQALLSVLLNKAGDSEAGAGDVDIGPSLSEFKDFTSAFPADLRGEALSNSDIIRDTHNSFAKSSPFVSDETRMATDDDDVYHFIAYTSINDTLYELDGLQPAPIRHGDAGACPPEIFSDAVVPVLQRRIGRYPITEIRFNLLAMCEDLRIQARNIGDAEMLQREEEKRRAWRWENALRRHNFVGFIGEVMKGVSRQKVKDGTYDAWVNEAKAATMKRVEERKKKGAQADEMDVS